MGLAPRSMNLPPSTGNASRPALDQSFSTPKTSVQPSFNECPYRQADLITQVLPTQIPSFLFHQEAPPLECSTSLNLRKQMQQPVDAGALKRLVEECCPLTPQVDSTALPRPLDGDVEPKSFVEMYPFNCGTRYLQLTSAIPKSQLLLSRWHLPLGLVIHPLVEASHGEKLSIVNFGPSGIIQYGR